MDLWYGAHGYFRGFPQHFEFHPRARESRAHKVVGPRLLIVCDFILISSSRHIKIYTLWS